MAHPQSRSTLRPILLAGGGLVAVGLVLSGVMLADGMRNRVTEADLARSEAAVAEMDAAQARANAVRAESQKRVYKGY